MAATIALSKTVEAMADLKSDSTSARRVGTVQSEVHCSDAGRTGGGR